MKGTTMFIFLLLRQALFDVSQSTRTQQGARLSAVIACRNIPEGIVLCRGHPFAVKDRGGILCCLRIHPPRILLGLQ
jgi:hypothetical protein